MPELVLKGCRSRPLAGYLKALGIFSVLTARRMRWPWGSGKTRVLC